MLGVAIFIGVLFWTAFGLSPITNFFNSRGDFPARESILDKIELAVNTHSEISGNKDGIYMFQEFLNISLADTNYSEIKSYEKW